MAATSAWRAALRRRRGRGFECVATLAVGLLLAGCQREPQLYVAQHLLNGDATATIRNEKRPVIGSEPATLLAKRVEKRDQVPRSVPLPANLEQQKSLVVSYAVWLPDAKARHLGLEQGTEVLPVEHTPSGARVSLKGLPELVKSLPATIGVAAYEGGGREPESTQLQLAVPRHAVFAVGYGIRPEAWIRKAYPTRFAVSATTSSGETAELFTRTLEPMNPKHQRWFDEWIDLAAFAGQQVTIGLRTEPAAEKGSFSLPVWAEPVLYTSHPAVERPNVLLISIDTLRAENLGCYGYRRNTSPFIDSLARAGVLFENAITASAVTGPSHMSLFTGLYPPGHGMVEGLEYKPKGIPTLARLAREGGYRTAAFTEDGYLVNDRGFSEGFAQYTENRGAELIAAPGQARATFGMARHWIERNRGFPFFLFVHTYQVHDPYAPPPPYDELFAGDGLPGPADTGVRRKRDNYDREIRLVDDEMRELFATLGHAGLGRSTIAVILSDHGEEFAEHGVLQHGATVFDHVLRVPLIFWSPGRIPAGVRHTRQVSLVDVAPTLLDLMGLPVPKAFDGRSLRPAVVEGKTPKARPLFAEAPNPIMFAASGKAKLWNPPLIALRSNGRKYVVHRPKKGMVTPAAEYDLRRDPRELAPSPVAGAELQALERAVDEYLRGPAARRREAKTSAATPARPLSPEVREKLRALGYVE